MYCDHSGICFGPSLIIRSRFEGGETGMELNSTAPPILRDGGCLLRFGQTPGTVQRCWGRATAVARPCHGLGLARDLRTMSGIVDARPRARHLGISHLGNQHDRQPR